MDTLQKDQATEKESLAKNQSAEREGLQKKQHEESEVVREGFKTEADDAHVREEVAQKDAEEEGNKEREASAKASSVV